MIHLEVNWKDAKGQDRVIRDLRPTAFKYDYETNTVAIYNNVEQWYDKTPDTIFGNVTSITYWDDRCDATEVYNTLKKKLSDEIPN